MNDSTADYLKEKGCFESSLYTKRIGCDIVASRSWAIDESWSAEKDPESFAGDWVVVSKISGKVIVSGPDIELLLKAHFGGYVVSKAEIYRNCHLVMTREYGVTPWNSIFGGQWVVRDVRDGSLIDNSFYSNDLIDKYKFETDKPKCQPE